jgi:hypothetical protein
MGECHCEDEARKVVENMLNQVHVVGEGYATVFLYALFSQSFASL